MSPRRITASAVGTVAIIAVLIGCGSGNGRTPSAGSVTSSSSGVPSGPATTGLLSDQIDMLFAPVVIVPHIQSGKVRAIGVTTPKRTPLFPDIPTIAETGLPGYESLGWFGVFAPAKTPEDIVNKVSADIGKVLHGNEAKRLLNEQGAEPEPNSAPVRRWQAWQWQDETRAGSPASRTFSPPQWQDAVRSRGMVMRRTLARPSPLPIRNLIGAAQRPSWGPRGKP